MPDLTDARITGTNVLEKKYWENFKIEKILLFIFL